MMHAAFIKSLQYGVLQNFEGELRGVSIDSRKAKSANLFFALLGENTDGHNFIPAARQNGAALCCVNRNWFEQSPHDDGAFWIVEDTTLALQKLAARWRQEFGIPILGITGTNGKTTCRSMIESVLKQRYDVHATTGNLNNQLGLPLTLLELAPEHEISVLEMGTNHFGEIRSLCEIARPTVALITNIGHGHLEFFGSLEGVAQAKQEIFDALPVDGLAFVNADDPHIAAMPTPENRITFAFRSGKVDFHGEILGYTDEGRCRLQVNDLMLTLKIPGKTPALNALPAVAVGKSFGVPDADIKNALENFAPVNQRFVIRNDGPCRIIDDSYNANPDSTIAGLESLLAIPVSGRRIFVMGDMLELGATAEAGHRRVGEKAVQMQIDYLLAHGPLSVFAIESARQAGMPNAFHFPQKVDLIRRLRKILKPDDMIYVKGSRGIHMEEIINELRQ